MGGGTHHDTQFSSGSVEGISGFIEDEIRISEFNFEAISLGFGDCCITK
jgi:hypothetical protein